MAVARIGGDRRSRRQRRERRRLMLAAQEPLAAGLRRMALAQADVAIEEVQHAPGEDGERAIHEARKAIKRMRTIVRILEGELGPEVCARDQSTLRSAAAGLAAARDAGVLLSTLDGVVARDPRRLAGKRGVSRLRARLAADLRQAQIQVRDPAVLLRVAAELRAFRAGAAAWPLSEGPGIASVEVGLRRIYRQGRRREGRAARKGGGRIEVMHAWRKRVKDLRYATEALRRAEDPPKPLRGAGRPRGRRAREDARWLAGVASAADDLGELLGEEHDLAVLAEWLARCGKQAGAGRGTRRRLARLIARRRAKLRRRALRRGRKLYRRRPRRFMARVERAHRRCAPKLS